MVQLDMNLHGVTASWTGIIHSGSLSDLKGVKARITQGVDGSAQHEFAWSNCIQKEVKARITQGMDGLVQERFAWSNCILDGHDPFWIVFWPEGG